MRTYDNVTGYKVSYSVSDANDFACCWPGSNVEGSGWFAFDDNGNLLCLHGSAELGSGGRAWLAFSQDCQAYGKAHIDALRKRHARQAVQA